MCYYMKMGACATEPERVRILKKYGYDFFEFGFAWVRGMSEQEFEELLAVSEETGLRGEGANCFADPPMRLFNCTHDELDDYLESGLVRAKRLGMQYLVIGSGYARSIPDGMLREEAMHFFITMLQRFGKIAEQYDIDIIIEPLFSKACNFINTFREGLALCRAVNHPRVGCLMDFFHSYQENEPFSVLEEAGSHLKHIHLSTLDRRIPGDGDVAETQMLAQLLKDIDYCGRVTMEGDAQVDFDAEIGEFSRQFGLFAQ